MGTHFYQKDQLLQNDVRDFKKNYCKNIKDNINNKLPFTLKICSNKTGTKTQNHNKHLCTEDQGQKNENVIPEHIKEI